MIQSKYKFYKLSIVLLLVVSLLSACTDTLNTLGTTGTTGSPDTFSSPITLSSPDTQSTQSAQNASDATIAPDTQSAAPAETVDPLQSGVSPSVQQFIADGQTSRTSEFIVYFLDVGQADSALVICDGATMLIDGGNAADSNFIYSFLRDHEITHLNYIIATHAHEDHVGGLSGALNYTEADVALCPVTAYDSAAFNNFVKYLGAQNVTITVPAHGHTFMLGSAEVLIVGPVKQTTDTNNSSIVLKITYGETSFLFTGDAERPAEQDILEVGYDISATVLKVGHHGSETSTTYPFLREIMPQFAVISCGKDNIYGHPHDDVLSRLRDADVVVYRTDMQGTIVCVSDGKTVSFSAERNQIAETNPLTIQLPDDEEFYYGNSKSMKFHRPSCSGLPGKQNRVVLKSREEAIRLGYQPCGRCDP